VSEFHIGVIKGIVEGRGFCFLSAPKAGDRDVFCHYSEFKKAGLAEPEKGEAYEYQIQVTEKGPQAIHIRPVM
jgi:cold shock CspA family protein